MNEARMRFADAVIGILQTDAEGRFVDVNPALVAMLGYASAEELLAADTLRDVVTDPLAWQNALAASGEPRRVEWRRADDARITIRLRGQPLPDGGVQLVAEDITETQRLEDQLRHAQRMDAISQLAGGVAHEFNNLITVIKGNADLLREELEDDSPLVGDLDCIREAADAATHLTGQLSALGKRKVMKPQLVDLNDRVAAIEEPLKRVVPENITIETVRAQDLGGVYADPVLIEQVLLNLIINARDAMPEGGRIAITTANVDVGPDAATGAFDPAPGSYAVVAVTDTGVGMDEDTARRAFEPFFTTKTSSEKGTGLGLSTAFGIVAQSGGKITAYSKLGKGSTFRVYLPIVKDGETRGSRRPADTLRGAETILVVEDGADVRELVRKVLARRGYKLLVAKDGADALELLAGHKEQVHLILTDLVMPHMSGRELVRKVRAVRRDIKVMFMSGHAEEVMLADEAELDENEAFLEKPFDPLSLALGVRRLLERGSHVVEVS